MIILRLLNKKMINYLLIVIKTILKIFQLLRFYYIFDIS